MLSRAMKDSGVEWIGEIPKEWKLRKLKYLLEERNEKNSPVKTKDILSLSVQRGVFPYSEKVGGGNKAKEDLTAYKLTYPGDIVINSMNILAGAVGLSKYFGAVSPVYYTLFADDENINIDYYYSLFLTKEFQKSLLGLGNGIMMKESDNGKLNTIRMRIPLDKLLSLKLPVPSLEEQNRITKYVNEKIVLVDKILSDTQQSIIELKKYKQSLITETVTKGLDKNAEMKDSGVEWIGEIPSERMIYRVKNLFFLKGRIGWQGLTSNEYKTEGPHLITGTDFKEGRINWKSTVRISEERFLEAPEIHIKNRDLLITKDGTIGKVAIVEDAPEKVSLNSGVLLIRCQKKQVVEIKYFYYILLSDLFWKWYRLNDLGASTIKHLYQGQFYNFSFPLPCKKEQQQVVDFLEEKTSKIDSLIKDKEQIIKEYEDYKKSLIYEYVTGKKQV